jgi:hypothetical protein
MNRIFTIKDEFPFLKSQWAGYSGAPLATGRTAGQGQPQQNVSKILSQQLRWAWWHMPVIPSIQEAQAGGPWSRPAPKKKERKVSLYLEKELKQKKDGVWLKC